MRWIKTAAIIGLVFLVIGFGLFVYSLITSFGEPEPYVPGDASGGMPMWLIIVLGVLSLAAMFFFYFGFAKVGDRTESNLLKVSSWLIIASIFLLLLSLLFVWISVKSIIDQQGSLLQQSAQVFGGSGDPNSFLTGNAVVGIDSLLQTTGFFIGLTIFVLLLLFVSLHLFYVSLAEISGKLRFTKLAAIFGLLGISSYIIVVGLQVSFLLFFFAFNKTFFIIIVHIPYVIGLLALLFQTRALFAASSEFETDHHGDHHETHDSDHSGHYGGYHEEDHETNERYHPEHAYEQQVKRHQARQEHEHSAFMPH